MVLDGFGLSDSTEYNAVAMANTPVIDKLKGHRKGGGKDARS